VLSDWLHAALGGVRWGLQFNPLAALASSIGASALVGYPSAPRSRWFWATVLLVGAWLIGDGVDIAARIPSGPIGPLDGWGVAVMVVVSLGLGFVLPAAAGAYVGRHVTRGTGWLSAMAVAAMVAGAFIAIAPVLSHGIAARAGG
jgi:hypothetical protein